MIVIGVDVHKHSLTAVAVDETGRPRAERTLQSAEEGVGAWASELGAERLWAVEDCRHVTGALERELVAAGERLPRVAPERTGPEATGGGGRARAGARARGPRLHWPRAGEEGLRELKLLVVHRDDLVDERRRAQQRLRWHLHELDPTLAGAPGGLARAGQL